MRYFFLPAVGLLLAGLTLLPTRGQAQAASPTSRPAVRPVTKPRKARKPAKPAKPAPSVTLTPAPTSSAPVLGAAGAVSRKGSRTQLPNTPALQAALQHTMAVRKQDAGGLTPEQFRAQCAGNGQPMYDEHPVMPKLTAVQHMERWRDHLIFQASLLEMNGAAKLFGQGDVTVLAPTDAALLPTTPSGMASLDQLSGYIIKGAHKLSELPEREPTTFETLDGSSVVIERDGKLLTLTTADKRRMLLTATDLPCLEGFINVLDAPLTQ